MHVLIWNLSDSNKLVLLPINNCRKLISINEKGVFRLPFLFQHRNKFLNAGYFYYVFRIGKRCVGYHLVTGYVDI